MIKSHNHASSIYDRPTNVGRSQIDASTLTMNGGPIQPGFTLDAAAGTISRDVPSTTDKTRFTFEYEYFAPAEVSIVADKASIIANGVEKAILTIACEDLTETIVKLAVYQDNKRLTDIDGNLVSVSVPVVSGVGTKNITLAETGTYEYRADVDILDGVWSLPKFRPIQNAFVEGV